MNNSIFLEISLKDGFQLYQIFPNNLCERKQSACLIIASVCSGCASIWLKKKKCFATSWKKQKAAELNQQAVLWQNNAHALLLMFSATRLWSFNLLGNLWNVLVWIPTFCNNGVLKFWFIIFIMTRGKEKTGQITATNVYYLVIILWRSIGFHCAEMSLVEVWIRTWIRNKKKSISLLKHRVMAVGWWTNVFWRNRGLWHIIPRFHRKVLN